MANSLDKELEDILFTAAGGISDMGKKEIEAIKQAFKKHALPPIESTLKELDEKNSHLDSRLFQQTHDYNRGYIACASDIVDKLNLTSLNGNIETKG